jgi:uncharacterized membrane protein
MIATAMSANVFFWIIPGQRKVVAALKAGQPVDPVHGQRGKQRSVHNTYFTLPVLFAMLSNHYSWTYSHEYNWAVLIALMFAGAAIRQFFVLRHGYKLGRNRHPWPYAAAGVVALLALVVEQHCIMCHGAQMQSKNVRLDSPEAIRQHALSLYQQTVVTRQMPMNNATGMTEPERALIAAWFRAGAAVE